MRKNRSNEAMAIIKYIIADHTEKEAADEFCMSVATIQRRIKSLGFTYSDLEKLKKKQSNFCFF